MLGDKMILIKSLMDEIPYQLNHSKYLPTLKKERREIYNDLKAWFKIPDHMNSACNILKVIDKLYDIPEDEKTGLLSYIFDNYEILAYVKIDGSIKPDYSRLQIKRELKARKFKSIEKVDPMEDNYYIWNPDLMLVLDKPIQDKDKATNYLFWYAQNMGCKIVEGYKIIS